MGLTLRAFVALLAAALPPVVALLILGSGAQGALDPDRIVLFGLGTLAVTIGWTAIMAILVSRVMGQELGELLHLAERGGSRPASPSSSAADTAELDARSRRLTETLDERNRQVAELAAKANAAPISDDPGLVAGHVVDTVRSVTGDPTWLLAVLHSSDPTGLAAGIYERGREEPWAATELHRWAATAGDPVDGHVRRVDGPWGAFVIVDVAAHERLRAVLLAPWEGRPDPSAAELDLLSLVGQHAATAIEHALLYATVRHQADELDRMGAVQRDFLRAVSHDLQTPLASIRALAGELRSRPPLDADSAEDLDLIEHQADRLRRMVQQLLAMSRLEAGVLAPQPEVISGRPLVERTWAALRAADRRLELRVEEPQLLLVADPDRLEQVLWAILDNAVKYSPASSSIGVTLGAVDPSGTRALIAVHDVGHGMDHETTERAFEQFYRSDQARRIAPDGSGIGLYTARGLMEAMGGSVRISSGVGQGTTIILELPAEPVEEREPAEVRR